MAHDIWGYGDYCVYQVLLHGATWLPWSADQELMLAAEAPHPPRLPPHRPLLSETSWTLTRWMRRVFYRANTTRSASDFMLVGQQLKQLYFGGLTCREEEKESVSEVESVKFTAGKVFIIPWSWTSTMWSPAFWRCVWLVSHRSSTHAIQSVSTAWQSIPIRGTADAEMKKTLFRESGAIKRFSL